MIPGCPEWRCNAVLGALLAGGLLSFAAGARAQSNGVLREVYSNISGALVSDLTSHPSFPGSPSIESITTNFEAPTNVGDN